MKHLILRLAGTAVLVAAVGCQNQELVPATPGETPRLDVLASSTTQNVAGIVKDLDTEDVISGEPVWFLDASNAEMLGEVTTAADGKYDSGLLPVGGLRIRVGGAGGYPPAFYGANGFDDFCDGTVVSVAPSTTAEVNMFLKYGPMLIVTWDGEFKGKVVDAETGDPVQGIEVEFRNAGNSFVHASTETDLDGMFAIALKSVRSKTVRVRFSDPSMTYLPQYYGADGLDVFCDGTELNVAPGETVEARLERVPPASLTETLLETVDGFGLPGGEGTMLVAPLTRLVVVLNDDNSANDGAACGELRGFLSRVNVQERRGVLTTEEADALRAQAATIQEALGCA